MTTSDTAVPFKRLERVTVRLTPYEASRLELVRRHRLPAGARARPAGPAIVECIVQIADQLERHPVK